MDAQYLLKIPFKIKLARGERLIVLRNHLSVARFTLIQGFLGHLIQIEGDFAYGGRIGYLPKIPFLSNDTIRNNILFSEVPDEARIRMVEEMVGLNHELSILSKRDKVVIE